MTWFVLSLIAILFWSGSDLFSKMGSKPEDKYSHWKMVMAVGTVMGLHAIVMLALGTPFHPRDIITYMPASAMYILSMVLGYVGLRYIELSISSPICNSSGAVAALLCFIFLGQRMTGLQLFGVVLVCAGVLALAVIERRQDESVRLALRKASNVKYERSVIAILFPILYCLIDGLGTFADAVLIEGETPIIAEGSANIAYELTFLAMGVFAFIYVVGVKKQKLSIPKEKEKLIAAVSETAGQFAYIYAIAANAVVAAPMISSYCVMSLVWARIILKEKLTKPQYAVIAVTAVGIAILGME